MLTNFQSSFSIRIDKQFATKLR